MKSFERDNSLLNDQSQSFESPLLHSEQSEFGFRNTHHQEWQPDDTVVERGGEDLGSKVNLLASAEENRDAYLSLMQIKSLMLLPREARRLAYGDNLTQAHFLLLETYEDLYCSPNSELAADNQFDINLPAITAEENSESVEEVSTSSPETAKIPDSLPDIPCTPSRRHLPHLEKQAEHMASNQTAEATLAVDSETLPHTANHINKGSEEPAPIDTLKPKVLDTLPRQLEEQGMELGILPPEVDKVRTVHFFNRLSLSLQSRIAVYLDIKRASWERDGSKRRKTAISLGLAALLATGALSAGLSSRQIEEQDKDMIRPGAETVYLVDAWLASRSESSSIQYNLRSLLENQGFVSVYPEPTSSIPIVYLPEKSSLDSLASEAVVFDDRLPAVETTEDLMLSSSLKEELPDSPDIPIQEPVYEQELSDTQLADVSVVSEELVENDASDNVSKSSGSQVVVNKDMVNRQQLEGATRVEANKSVKPVTTNPPVVSSSATESSIPAPRYEANAEREAWMAAAGIDQSDYKYVSFIINKESNWRPYIWNEQGSSAYGLCQTMMSLYGDEVADDFMTNPVSQLKWCHAYAMRRYGSWRAAYEHWVAKKWW